MLAYTYIEHGRFGLLDKPKPELKDSRDAIVRVTLGSICTHFCALLCIAFKITLLFTAKVQK